MKKRADAFRSIGETAKMIGVPPHVLRYWETQFSQLKPMKRADGRRYYRPEDVRLAAGLCEILRDDGMTIRGAKKILAQDRGESIRQRGETRLADAGALETTAPASSPTQNPKKTTKAARIMTEPDHKTLPSETVPATQTLPLFPDLLNEAPGNGADWLPNLINFTTKLRMAERLAAAPRRKAVQLRDAIAGLY